MEQKAPTGHGRKSKLVDEARDGLAIRAEYLQTDQWAIDAILRHEILTRRIVDPCCGDGRMARTAQKAGYLVEASDLYDWGFGRTELNFLTDDPVDTALLREWVADATVFMNPPFSLATQFVDRAHELGARKIVCFQRAVWRESRGRKEWWERNQPARIAVCGDRAVCWYGTIPEELRESGMNQPHAWYIWERGHPPAAVTYTIWNANPSKRALRRSTK